MFIHNLSPVLFSIGPLDIRYYSLAYIIGFVIAYLVFWQAAKHRKIKNLTLKNYDEFIIYVILGVLIGSRLGLYLFYSPLTLLTDPLDFFKVWQGGMSFHGGLIGTVIAGWLFTRKYKIKFYQMADLIMLFLPIILCLGRIANFINAELIGTVTKSSWCVQYEGVEGCRHASQLYEAGKNLVIFVILNILNKYHKFKDGIIFWMFVLLYGIFRFAVTFFRDDPRYLGLSMGQYLNIVMVVVAVVFLYRLKKN